MGTVYRGFDESLNRPVVLKVLLPALATDENARSRFVREAEAARRLVHPNVVRLYGVGELDEPRVPYIAMEFIEGESLEERMKRGPIPWEEAVRYIKGAARGVEEAHRNGIVHRDLKPQNIMVDGSGEAKVLDFGVARVYGAQRLTRMGDIVGTPEYMPPEQAEGGEVDERSDIYALGATLHALLSGRAPFEGSSLSLLKKVVLDPPPPLQKFRPDLPHGLYRFVPRCMEKDPMLRPQTAGAFIDELESAAEGKAVGTPPTRPTGRSWRIPKVAEPPPAPPEPLSSKLLSLALAGLAVTLVAVAVLAVVAFLRALG